MWRNGPQRTRRPELIWAHGLVFLLDEGSWNDGRQRINPPMSSVETPHQTNFKYKFWHSEKLGNLAFPWRRYANYVFFQTWVCVLSFATCLIYKSVVDMPSKKNLPFLCVSMKSKFSKEFKSEWVWYDPWLSECTTIHILRAPAQMAWGFQFQSNHSKLCFPSGKQKVQNLLAPHV